MSIYTPAYTLTGIPSHQSLPLYAAVNGSLNLLVTNPTRLNPRLTARILPLAQEILPWWGALMSFLVRG
jgi:hypothetical protein